MRCFAFSFCLVSLKFLDFSNYGKRRARRWSWDPFLFCERDLWNWFKGSQAANQSLISVYHQQNFFLGQTLGKALKCFLDNFSCFTPGVEITPWNRSLMWEASKLSGKPTKVKAGSKHFQRWKMSFHCV